MFTNKKKEYFKHKLSGVQKMLWDFEFKREKTIMIREEVRREYDNVKSKLNIIVTKIQAQLKDPKKVCEVHNPEAGKEKVHKDKGTCACEYVDNAIPVADIEGLYDQKEILSRDAFRYESQMKQMDLDVAGTRPTSEYPDGMEGINDQIDSLRELKAMLEQYVTKL